MAGFIHGARASDSRTLHDGINTRWAGAHSNAAISNVAGSQETVLTISIYTVANNDAVTQRNNGYSPTGAWLTPTAIQPARYIRLNMQIDF